MAETQVEIVRRFNRLYTQRLGILDEGWLGTSYSLATVRVLFELGQGRTTARDIANHLRLDRGYLSRILSALESDGLLTKEPSEEDKRQRILALTKKGRRILDELDTRQSDDVSAMLAGLQADERVELVSAMQTCTRLLGPRGEGRPRSGSYVLRAPKPGDLGWIVHRHGALYAEEYGWDVRFEGLVASVVGDFAANAEAKRDRCWIADREGEILGSIMVVQTKKKNVAKLRLLLVEPKARGLGLGTRLVAEAIAFATRAGYQKLELWTNDVLLGARRVYERAGFVLVNEVKSAGFGSKVTEQTWELTLGAFE